MIHRRHAATAALLAATLTLATGAAFWHGHAPVSETPHDGGSAWGAGAAGTPCPFCVLTHQTATMPRAVSADDRPRPVSTLPDTPAGTPCADTRFGVCCRAPPSPAGV